MVRSFILVIGSPATIDRDAIVALQSRGDVCLYARGLEQAAVLAGTFRASAIVLDATRSGVLDPEALRRISGSGAEHVPVVAVTAAQAAVPGADSVVHAPCAAWEIAAAVDAARGLPSDTTHL